MTSLLKKIIIYDPNGDNPIEITDDERITLKISMGSTGSTMDITLKNAFEEYVLNEEFRFGTDNILKLWLKWATEPTDEINTGVSDDLVMSVDVIDIEAKGEENSTAWKLNCMDRTFVILNRLFVKSYREVDYKTTPLIIKEIINFSVGTGKGILSTNIKADLAEGAFDSNGVFQRTGGGYIQNVRPDNSPFPVTTISKVYKPVYEWIDDLSQPDRTNTQDELTATGTVPPSPRPHFAFIDENNNFHWEYPSTDTPSHHMTWGTSSAVSPDTVGHYITSFDLKKAVFDIVNFVIFNAGDDFFGSGILNYHYDPTTKATSLKPVYRAWTDISSEVIKTAILVEHPTKFTEDNATPGTLTWQGKRYTATYNFTPFWTTTAVSTDTTLNNSLRDYCALDDNSLGKNRARRLTHSKANPRWKGRITLRGEKFSIGELVQFNSTDHGILDAKVRIKDIQHSIDKSGWTTILSVEEDALEITNG